MVVVVGEGGFNIENQVRERGCVGAQQKIPIENMGDFESPIQSAHREQADRKPHKGDEVGGAGDELGFAKNRDLGTRIPENNSK